MLLDSNVCISQYLKKNSSCGLLLFLTIATITFVESIEYDNEQTRIKEKGISNLNSALNTIEQMSKSDSSSGSTSIFRLPKKLKTAGKKVAALNDRMNSKLGNDAEGKAERVSEAISGVGEGVITLVTAINEGDWISGVQGALGKYKRKNLKHLK